jgi:DNA-binding transcriptional LysR family regulator
MTYSLPETLPPLESLAAAIAAARYGSFSAAAAGLGVTHAAISRRVAAAERWAGIRLFERHGRGVRPTGDGRRLLARLSQAIEALDQVAVRRERTSLKNVVRISTTASFARCWLLPRVKEIEASVVGARLEIEVDQRSVDLQRESVDVAIRYGRGGWKGVREAKLFDDLLLPVAAPDLAARVTAMAKVNGILALPHLHVGDAANWRAWGRAMGRTHRLKPSDRFLAEYSLALTAAEAGLGALLFNVALSGRGQLPKTLVALSERAVVGPYGYYALTASSASGAALAVAAVISKITMKTQEEI